MKQRRDIKSLSVELRTRLEKEIFSPLLSLENIAGTKTYSVDIVEKVFKDFRQINNGIWDELCRNISKVKKETLINKKN